MPINPVTKREQVYPGADSIEEFENSWDILNTQTSESEANSIIGDFGHKYFSFLFALIAAKKEKDVEGFERRTRDFNTLQSEMNDSTSNSAEFSVWISELIQNAIDAKWYDSPGATEIILSFSDTEIVFQHNGRPPHYQGFAKNEFQSMIEKGSTKKSNLANEGKFGIGFKFWTFFFGEVKLEADCWQINWNRTHKLGEISDSEFNGGMKLTFTNPSDEYLEKLKSYKESVNDLINIDLSRLIEGISVQKIPLNFTVNVMGKNQFNLNHGVETKTHNHSGKDREYFEINNGVDFGTDIDLRLYVPSKLIGYDVNCSKEKETYSTVTPLIDSLQEEFHSKMKKDREDPFLIKLLQNESAENGLTWDSDENIRKAAESQAKNIQALCLIDISEEMKSHYQIYSLFPLNSLISGIRKEKIKSRISYVGTYTLDQERTRLDKETTRNKSIAKAQYESLLVLLGLISDNKFQAINTITNSVYVEILDSLNSKNSDSEFILLCGGIKDE